MAVTQYIDRYIGPDISELDRQRGIGIGSPDPNPDQRQSSCKSGLRANPVQRVQTTRLTPLSRLPLSIYSLLQENLGNNIRVPLVRPGSDLIFHVRIPGRDLIQITKTASGPDLISGPPTRSQLPAQQGNRRHRRRPLKKFLLTHTHIDFRAPFLQVSTSI